MPKSNPVLISARKRDTRQVLHLRWPEISRLSFTNRPLLFICTRVLTYVPKVILGVGFHSSDKTTFIKNYIKKEKNHFSYITIKYCTFNASDVLSCKAVVYIPTVTSVMKIRKYSLLKATGFEISEKVKINPFKG